MPKFYDAITGEEAAKLLGLAILEALREEGRLGRSQCYHNVVLKGNLELESYPHEPAVEDFPIAVEVGPKKGNRKGKVVKVPVTFEQEHSVPDLAREQIEAAEQQATPAPAAEQEDVALLTGVESKGP